MQLTVYVNTLLSLANKVCDGKYKMVVTKFAMHKLRELRKNKVSQLPKKLQLEIYLRSNEHTHSFMTLLDEKELI